MPSPSFRIGFSWSSLPWLQSSTSPGFSVSLPSSLPKWNYNIESTLLATFLHLVVEVEDFKEHVWSHVSIRSSVMNQFSYLLFGKTFFDTFQCPLKTFIPLLKNHFSHTDASSLVAKLAILIENWHEYWSSLLCLSPIPSPPTIPSSTFSLR